MRLAKTFTSLLLLASTALLPSSFLLLHLSAPVIAQAVPDPKAEADRLLQEAESKLEQWNLQSEQLLVILRQSDQALLIYRKVGDLRGQRETLALFGKIYHHKLQQYSTALEYYQQVLVIGRQLEVSAPEEAWTLKQISDIYRQLQDPNKEIEMLQQIAEIYERRDWSVWEGDPLLKYELEVPERLLVLYRQFGNQIGEAKTLHWIADMYQGFGQYPQATKYFQQALMLYRKLGNQEREVSVLQSLTISYLGLEQYSQSLNYAQQAMTLYRQLGNREGEMEALLQISSSYLELKQYSQSLEYARQALILYYQLEDQEGEAETLLQMIKLQIINSYLGLEQYPQAAEIFQQVIIRHQQLGDKKSEVEVLLEMVRSHLKFKQYSQALNYIQQTITLYRQLGDKEGEAEILLLLSSYFFKLEQYPQASEYAQQALMLYRQINNRDEELRAFWQIARIYQELRQYSKALEYYNQLLAVSKLEQLPSGISPLQGIADIYWEMKEYSKALEYYHQAIEPNGFADQKLIILAERYEELKQYEKALELYREWLISSRLINIPNEGNPENDIINLAEKIDSSYWYQISQYNVVDINLDSVVKRMANNAWNLKRYTQALKYYQELLIFYRKEGDRQGEALIFSSLGENLFQDGKAELAITFYKQSINLYESVRNDLKVASQEKQKEYINKVAPTYRKLADILLQQDRILEAQVILDLLKVQELSDYLRNVRGNTQTAQGIDVLKPETEILKRYGALQNQAVKLGRELADLRQIPEAKRTPAQQQRLVQLVQLELDLNRQFNQFLSSKDIQTLVSQLSVSTSRQSVNLEDLTALRNDLKQVGNGALLYPLILDDRLELIITTPDAPPLRRTVNVTKADLNKAILEFRTAITDDGVDPKPAAKKLYDLLIKPLEADLQASNAQTIVYAPDGQLRYVPLAALYDGKQWLVERYRVNNITARSLTDFSQKSNPKIQVLAGAFVKGEHNFQVGERQFALGGLPFAEKEVQQIAKLIPNTRTLIDKDFSVQQVLPRLGDATIVHFATHATFLSALPEQSFILLGNGDRINLREVQDLSLQNVDLVVLSACQTGVGGILGNGEEILGLGYQFQRAGAKATIASLWFVSDQGTQELMTAFYEHLKQGKSKTEALQQAQIALIRGKVSTIGSSQNRSILFQPPAAGPVPSNPPVSQGSNTEPAFAHPYYWAPFILIGNGL